MRLEEALLALGLELLALLSMQVDHRKGRRASLLRQLEEHHATARTRMRRVVRPQIPEAVRAHGAERLERAGATAVDHAQAPHLAQQGEETAVGPGVAGLLRRHHAD